MGQEEPARGDGGLDEQALRENEARLSLAVAASQLGVWDWDLTTNSMTYSPEAKAIFGFPLDQPVSFEQVRDATHPDDYTWTWPMAQRAFDPELRENLPYEYRIVRPDGSIRWALARGQAIFAHDGQAERAVRYIGTIQDVTESKALALALAASEANLRLAMDAGRMAVLRIEPEAGLTHSPQLRRLLGLTDDEELTIERFRQHYLPGERERVQAAVRGAIEKGESACEVEFRYRGPGGAPGWLLLRAEIESVVDGDVRAATGVLIDITERKAAEAALRESEERLRALADNLPSGMVFQTAPDPDGGRRFSFVSSNCERLNGVPAEAAMADPRALYALIDPDDAAAFRAAEQQAIAASAPFDQEVRMRGADGAYHWQRISSAPRPIGEGQVLWDGIQMDVDAHKRSEEALREETRALQIINRAGALVAGNLDLQKLVQTITDAGVELTGADFGAFFYNVLDEAGESYTLYTLSGVAPEAFAKFPMPRNTAIFAPTFDGTGVVRSADIHSDPRYGRSPPYHGMPPGHLPVRSYMAVPVKSRSGDVLGGLFFGHHDVDVFTARAEALLSGLAGQAAVAIDNATLFQAAQKEVAQRREAEEALQRLNQHLERRIADEVRERSNAEEALRQAQKMEAVGQLTGGVAHDFNNLLTVIIGGLDQIRRSQPDEHVRVRRAADMALQGAERAASLTKRLLAFSRRQPLEPKPCDLNALVRDMTDLLHRTLGETIELEGVLAPRLWAAEIDKNQLEGAILNLALNARDAMPDGGKLTLETTNTALDESYAATDAEVVPGQYVAISISDTGLGMTKEVLDRAFEPFFTTKEVGKGSGLGLSMVYGFVKQSGGHVTLYSDEAEGTTITLYFPRYRGQAGVSPQREEAIAPTSRRDEVVLVVEDNEEVRSYSLMLLAELGYAALEAADAEAALSILAGETRVDLLFTDVVLPGKSGRVLAQEAKTLRPDLPVLFTTGYSRNAIVHHGRLDAGVNLISKPFTFEQLAGRLRAVLDEKAGDPA